MLGGAGFFWMQRQKNKLRDNNNNELENLQMPKIKEVSVGELLGAGNFGEVYRVLNSHVC